MNGKVVTDVGDAMYAIQGAMAIRRQRQMRENRRLSQVRMSTKKGSTSTPRGSDAAASAGEAATAAAAHYEPKSPPKTETSQTAFFLGIVFILLGFLMIFASMISNSGYENHWSRLLGVGVTFLLFGLIMVMVNRIISAREEEELSQYVRHRLGRSWSGHTLFRDTDSGEDFHIRMAAQLHKEKGSMPPRSPRDKSVDPFPKFRQGSQVSTRVGSARTSPIGPGPKSFSQHSSLAGSNHHVQNGKPVVSEPIPIVVVEEPTDTSSSPMPAETVETVESVEAVLPPRQDSVENGDVPFSAEVISETESLLKKQKLGSVKKSKPKKALNS